MSEQMTKVVSGGENLKICDSTCSNVLAGQKLCL